MNVAILGVAVDNLTMDEFLLAVDHMIAEGGFHQVATANADFLMKSIGDDELHEVLCRCDFVLPDGMPLIWTSRLLGTGLKERVAGADLVPRLARLSEERGYRLFLLGAGEESSAGTAAWIAKHHPGACIAGRYCPPLNPLEEMDHEDILGRIEAARPDILLVAFGNPKQEKWLAMHRHRLRVPVCIGVGGSFDFLSGRISRAPRWMQRYGLEWFHRAMQEPGRLGKRYIANGVALLRYLPVQVAFSFLQQRTKCACRVETASSGAARILRVEGDFTGDCVRLFEAEVRKATEEFAPLVVDLSGAGLIGADGLATMVRTAARMDYLKRELWITGLRPSARRVLRAAHLGSFFRTAPKIADALRRMTPEIPAVAGKESDCAYFRLGGKLVSLYPHEVKELYSQLDRLLRHRTTTNLPTEQKTQPPTGEQQHGSLVEAGS